VVMAGAVVKLDLVWTFADIMNGLMGFPNLVGLLGLSNTSTIGGTFLSRHLDGVRKLRLSFTNFQNSAIGNGI